MDSNNAHLRPRQSWNSLAQVLPSRRAPQIRHWSRSILGESICKPWDRIAELGNERDEGHTGCVNAISWAQDGELLLTGSDDTNVCMWRLDPNSDENDYPLVNTAKILTGHTSNIFAAHMLPHSTRIVTCARDATVRISDVGHGPLTGRERGTRWATSAASVAVIRCHSEATKRVLLDDSPDHFLTVAEDGRVRQHDLRARPHQCRRNNGWRQTRGDLDSCGPPLVLLPHELHSISSSPLAPHQFVVAGDSPYGYLFDRRQTGRFLKAEWGVPTDNDNLTTCVRRFGPPASSSERRTPDHITGARMARSTSHEIILSYSGDAVYLYSSLDDPVDLTTNSPRSSSIIPPQPRTTINNHSPSRTASSPLQKSQEIGPADALSTDVTPFSRDLVLNNDENDRTNSVFGPTGEETSAMVPAASSSEALEPFSEELSHLDDTTMLISDEHGEDEDIDDDDEDEAEWSDEDEDLDESVSQRERSTIYDSVPAILPRRRYAGAANTRTIKDVNFLGPEDQLIASGSDDGHVFLWSKSTGKLHGIYEGDGSVVNVIEPHPSLPLIAVSGIDSTVKLFGPATGHGSRFNKLLSAESILARNEEASRRPARGITQSEMLRLLAMHYGGQEDDVEDGPVCVNQ